MMGRIPIYLLLILLPLLGLECVAQTDFDVSDPRFELKGNTVLIYYDILNSSPGERFDISIEITNAQGTRIMASALQGDIGPNIPGGNNRLIEWDLEADGIVMNAEILVKIHAKISQPALPPTIGKEEDQQEITHSYNRTGLIIQSMALPGLGLTRMTGKPHWIRGLAGYACIAGSVVFNKKAVTTYDEFLASETTDESDALLSRAIQQDNMSEVLAYAAIGIWVSDIIWTILGTRNSKMSSFFGKSNKASLTAGYNPTVSSPVIGINFRF